MQILHSYKHDDELRKSFNELSSKTFGINFEEWYQLGYWNDFFDPYSVIEDGRVVSNVSVNFIDMEYKGELLHLIQLGTVMTAPEFRNKGYSRMLMENILNEYESKCDGIFIFANDTVLDFYPKFGFTKYDEYRYTLDIESEGNRDVTKIPMNSLQNQGLIFRVLNKYHRQGAFNQIGNADLNMFYLTQSMKDCVYYLPSLDAYAVAEIDNGEIILHDVLAQQEVSIDAVVRAFGIGVQEVTLGFTPTNPESLKSEIYREDDTTLFMKGRVEDVLKGEKFKFPMLTHA